MCAGYSKWTNSSFRGPLLFSAAACTAGNLMYCYSYDSRFLWALYAARLLTGLGAPSPIPCSARGARTPRIQ